MSETKIKLCAYCDRGGVVAIAETAPLGMLPLAELTEDCDEALWKEALYENCQPIGFLITPEGKKERVYVVPSIRDAAGDTVRIIAALRLFELAVHRDLMTRIRSPSNAP